MEPLRRNHNLYTFVGPTRPTNAAAPAVLERKPLVKKDYSLFDISNTSLNKYTEEELELRANYINEISAAQCSSCQKGAITRKYLRLLDSLHANTQ